jgi:hypothetical protein
MPRDEEGYQRERLLLAMVPELLETNGLVKTRVFRRGGMKFAEGRTVDGEKRVFWVKQAWANHPDFAAIQFQPLNSSAPRTDDSYVESVRLFVSKAKALGAQYVLMVHMPADVLRDNYAVLDLDDLVAVYEGQLTGWPTRAKEGASPVLYFDDERVGANDSRIELVRRLTVPLKGIAGIVPLIKGASRDSKFVWAETERRMKQQAFRLLVGEACSWTCAVSGNTVRAVLDAAHLPGRDWRFHNAAEDGVMLRADLHRLLDRDLAEFRDGRFWIHEDARGEHYAPFHNVPYTSEVTQAASPTA